MRAKTTTERRAPEEIWQELVATMNGHPSQSTDPEYFSKEAVRSERLAALWVELGSGNAMLNAPWWTFASGYIRGCYEERAAEMRKLAAQYEI